MQTKSPSKVSPVNPEIRRLACDIKAALPQGWSIEAYDENYHRVVRIYGPRPSFFSAPTYAYVEVYLNAIKIRRDTCSNEDFNKIIAIVATLPHDLYIELAKVAK